MAMTGCGRFVGVASRAGRQGAQRGPCAGTEGRGHTEGAWPAGGVAWRGACPGGAVPAAGVMRERARGPRAPRAPGGAGPRHERRR